MTVQEKTNFDKVKEYSKISVSSLVSILSKWQAVIISSLITLSASLFFLVICFPALFLKISVFSQRSTGLLLLALVFIFSGLGIFFKKDTTLYNKLLVWLQSNIFTFFTFAYILRLNSVDINLFSVSLNTKLIGIPLLILIFFINLDIYGKNKNRLILLIPQVVLISLLTFAFINLLGVDRTALRTFSSDWLSGVFNLNNNTWLIISAVSISLITIINFKIKNFITNIILIGFFSLAMWQIMYAINLLQMTYWYKTLLLLVCWDFIYLPLKTILTDLKDPKYTPKFIVSSLYHLSLIVVILVYSTAIH